MTHRIDRRQALAAFGAVSLGGLLAACGDDGGSSGTSSVTTGEGTTATVQPKTSSSGSLGKLFDESASCSVTPEETEGPYYFDVDSIRSNIREDRDGVSLRLALRVRDATSCDPIENAVVDIWHCDALGTYSGFESASNGPPGGGRTDDETFLRGAQATNADGIVEFKTVYPGWYAGRTVHIHAKVHIDKQTVLTSQIFFDERVNAAVFKRSPYSEKTGRDVFNENDGIFDEALIATAKKDGSGYLGLMTFNVQSA